MHANEHEKEKKRKEEEEEASNGTYTLRSEEFYLLLGYGKFCLV
jgi:hypothetical protein